MAINIFRATRTATTLKVANNTKAVVDKDWNPSSLILNASWSRSPNNAQKVVVILLVSLQKKISERATKRSRQCYYYLPTKDFFEKSVLDFS